MAGIDEAIAFAAKAHAGAKDLDGNPVILHPLAVGLMGSTEEEKICGFLHDVVEDTCYTFKDLAEAGFSATVIDTLRLLTHSKSVPYLDYVRNICKSGNKTALAVKLNDLHHNLDRGKAGEHEKQVKKHTEALKLIEDFIAEQDKIYKDAAFQKFRAVFSSLHVARIQGFKAPHKYVLMLSILSLIDRGTLEKNIVYLSNELEQSFKIAWDSNVGDNSIFQAKIDTPFWHMNSELFWTLYTSDGEEVPKGGKQYSLKKLREGCFAKIDEDLWQVLLNPEMREALALVLKECIA